MFVFFFIEFSFNFLFIVLIYCLPVLVVGRVHVRSTCNLKETVEPLLLRMFSFCSDFILTFMLTDGASRLSAATVEIGGDSDDDLPEISSWVFVLLFFLPLPLRLTNFFWYVAAFLQPKVQTTNGFPVPKPMCAMEKLTTLAVRIPKPWIKSQLLLLLWFASRTSSHFFFSYLSNFRWSLVLGALDNAALTFTGGSA